MGPRLVVATSGGKAALGAAVKLPAAVVKQDKAVGGDDVFLAGAAKVGGDEVSQIVGASDRRTGVGGDGGGEGLGSVEGAVAFTGEDGDLTVVRGDDDVELSVAIDVVDDGGYRCGARDRVGRGAAERAVGVAEQHKDLAGGGGAVVDDDEVAVAVAVEVCGGDCACGGEAHVIEGEAGDAAGDQEGIAARHGVVADGGEDLKAAGRLADIHSARVPKPVVGDRQPPGKVSTGLR